MEITAAILFIFGSLIKAYDSDLIGVLGYSLTCLSLGMFCFSTYLKSKVFQYKKRLVMTIATIYCIMFLVNLFSVYTGLYLLSDTIYVFTLSLVVCFAMNSLLLFYRSGDKYMVRGTFIAMKKPKNLQGYVSSLFQRCGSMSLVIDSKEFKFQKGELVETEHKEKPSIVYEKVNNVPLSVARSYVGTRWKWYKNCFIVLKGIVRNEKRKQSNKRHTGKRSFRGGSK